MSKNTPWFLLYCGSSPDGTGNPRYCGRTTDAKVALNHFWTCARNPYSIGQVHIVTDDKIILVRDKSDFNPFFSQDVESN